MSLGEKTRASVRELPRDSLELDVFPSLYISCTGVVNKLFLETSNRSALESLLPVVTSMYRSSFVPATDKTKQKKSLLCQTLTCNFVWWM